MTNQKDNHAARHPSHAWNCDHSNLSGDHSNGAHCEACGAVFCLYCSPEANDGFGTAWRLPCSPTSAGAGRRKGKPAPDPSSPQRISTNDHGGE